MPDTTINRYQTHPIIPLDVYPVGTTRLRMEVRGNAILSSIFIKSAGAGSVKVNYFQSTTGTFPEDAERHDLTGHPLKSAADDGKTSQIVVTRVHNKPTLEFIVTGAPVEFGVYVTVTDELASDIDSALVLNEQVADLTVNKGIPIVCYDPDQNKFFFIQCEGGSIPVFLQNPGTRKLFQFNGVTTPGVVQDVINEVAHATLQTDIRRVRVSCRSHGAWELLADGVIISSGFTGPASPNNDDIFDIPEILASTKIIRLNFFSPSGHQVNKLDAYVQTTQK